MPTTCINCGKFSLQRVKPEEAARGLGHCELRAPFIRHQAEPERDCEDFRQAEADVVRKRQDFLARVQGGQGAAR